MGQENVGDKNVSNGKVMALGEKGESAARVNAALVGQQEDKGGSDTLLDGAVCSSLEHGKVRHRRELRCQIRIQSHWKTGSS